MNEHIVPGRGRPRRTDVYRRLDVQIEELRERMGGLPTPVEAADIWRDIWYEEAHHSTAIEGNTLVLKQVERLLAEGRAVGNKELREYMEVRGYADAADWVYRQATSRNGLAHPERILSLEEVRHVHHVALTPVWQVAPHPSATPREAPGRFREHEIHPFPGGMTPISWPLVPPETTTWIDQVNALDATEAMFPEALAAVHCRFEQIHPFLDGNGRAGRLILNLVLIRLGYPPVIIYKRDRARYLQALRHADAGESSRVPWARCSRGPSSTASTGSSSRPWPGRRGSCPGRAGDARRQGGGPARGGGTGPTPGHQRTRRPVAELAPLGRRVPGEPLPTRLDHAPGLGAGGKTISITVLRRASWRNRSPGCRDDSPS